VTRAAVGWRVCDVLRATQRARCAVDVPPSRNDTVASHRGSLLIIFTNLNVARLQTKSLCRSTHSAHRFGSIRHADYSLANSSQYALREHLHVRPTRVTIV
jgi:hypothetical protein